MPRREKAVNDEQWTVTGEFGDDVREDLTQLVDLQNLDLEIAKLQKEVQEVPRAIADLEQHLIASRGAWDQARGSLASLEQLRRSKERDLEEVTAEQRKRQGRLFEIKTNQEYAAVLKEIETLKDRRSRLEDETLELFDQIEAAQGVVRDQEALFQEREKAFQHERAIKEMGLKRLQGEFGRLQEERERQANRMDPGLLQIYHRLLRSRGGVAVVPVKDGSCLGCYVALTPQTYNELRKGEVLISCANCQRILYWKG
ncbi:MAG: zinc ribbon domain-containing protein [Candidatus Methylomirabilales bacterium]